MGVIPVRPLILGFIQADGVPRRLETALTGQLASWAQGEGYLLGVTYREQVGNGGFESLLQAITRHDAVGVVVPSFAHFGPESAARVMAVSARGGASVYAVTHTPSRGPSD
ncbi:hypothetical protein [Kribbella catacumbae]|uniref:hypothetical protein n=1 Tax=Kribbella catacumbae TaxID=460086 RepID=UPI000382C7AB|nr:hypothetical protein [Kribbella catacumbae]